MIDPVPPIGDLFQIIAAAVNAMGGIVFDAKLRQGAEHRAPCLRIDDKIIPIAVIYCNFHVFILCIIQKRAEIRDGDLTVLEIVFSRYLRFDFYTFRFGYAFSCFFL